MRENFCITIIDETQRPKYHFVDNDKAGTTTRIDNIESGGDSSLRCVYNNTIIVVRRWMLHY